jgi:multidrug resistance protein, MATE family
MSRPRLTDLLFLAWPVVVSRATQTIVGLADALMVAHLGPVALAATTTGATNTFIVLILPMGTVFIIQSFASQLFGRGDATGARRFAIYGLVIALATELIALATLPLIGPALSLFPYEPEVHAAMTSYLAWRLLSAGPAVGIEALGAYYGGVGRTWVPMIANVFLVVANVPLCWLLIDGHLGAPALGVAGSAIASTIATTVAFVGFFVYFLMGGPLPRPRPKELWRVLAYGIPAGLNWFFEFGAYNVFVNFVVAGLGTVPLAALMAVMQINSVSFMPAFGLASAGAILVGQSIGREDRDGVPRIVRMTFLTAATYQGLVGLAYVAVPALLFAPFANEDLSGRELLAIGVEMLMLSAAWQLFDSAVITLSEALRAAGDTVLPLAIRLVLAWVFFVPASFVFVQLLEGGVLAAMLSLLVYVVVLALVLWLWFRTGTWRRMKLTEPTV